MKVITQLIRHFWQRGLLSPAEAQYLLEHGFARPRDLPGHIAPIEVEECEPGFETVDLQFPCALEEAEDGLREKTAGRGPHAAHGKSVTIRQLRTRIRREFENRAEAMRTVLEVAQRIDPCENATEALAVLRRIPRQQFHDQCLAAIRARPESLGRLWQAMNLHPFFGLVARSECTGRVAQSYFALLVIDDPGLLGKYGWIMQYDELQAVTNLRTAHRRLLCLIGWLYRRQPRRLQRAMADGIEPVLFWALVLLYNARRGDSATFDPTREYGPLALPSDRILQQAWTEAAGMDRKALTPFLISCFSKHREKTSQPNDNWAEPLYCPSGWHQPAAAIS